MLQAEIKERYLAAVDSFVDKVRDDPNVIAVIVCGSLAYDVVWEKSDMKVFMSTLKTLKKLAVTIWHYQPFILAACLFPYMISAKNGLLSEGIRYMLNIFF